VISNEDVLRALERIADLLEIGGENVYKVRGSAVTPVEVR
jgi:DNA polymerase/3'-5' exonuclease PolX